MPKTKAAKRGPAPEVRVLVETPHRDDGATRYVGKGIDAARLGDRLRSFTDGLAAVLRRCDTSAGPFALAEMSVKAKLTPEGGFALVAERGVEGGIALKFVRRGRR
jgi:hypothetical protein